MNKKLANFGIYILHKLKLVKDKKKKKAKWDEYIFNFHNSAKLLLDSKKDFFIAFLFNLASLLAMFIIPLFLLWSMGDYSSFGIYETIIASSYVMMFGSFFPAPGGTGGLEFGFMIFFGTFIGRPQLTAIMLLWRAITYHFSLITGAAALYMKKVEA